MSEYHKYNTNDHVRVRLNTTGLEIYYKYLQQGYQALKQKAPRVSQRHPLQTIVPDANGYHEMSLYQLMHVFGPSIYGPGADSPFEDNVVEFDGQKVYTKFDNERENRVLDGLDE